MNRPAIDRGKRYADAMSKVAPKKKRPVYLWVLVAIALLILGVVLILPALIDAESFKPQIEQVLREATSWDAELGDVELSVLRGALGVSPASLTAPGGDTSSIAVGRIDVEVGILALLRKELRVESIRLVRPEILLVRPDEKTGWIVPLASAKDGDGASAAPAKRRDTGVVAGTGGEPASKGADGRASNGNGFSVVIEEVGVSDGTLRLLDHAMSPPLTFELSGLTTAFFPADGGINGEVSFGQDEGEARWRGQVGKTVEVTLDGLKTDLLQAFLGPDLIHAGGSLSGEVSIGTPLRIEGNLVAEGLTLIAGERPFDEAQLDFVVSPAGLGWQLESLEFRGDGAKLVGGGELSPNIALKLELPDTGLDAVLRASESVLPLPLDVVGPGNVRATILVDQPEGGELTYEASGSLSAAEVRPGDLLPPARDVEATFALNRAGRFDVEVANGTIAGGPVNGNAVIDSIDPPGRLTFTGGLKDAVFGQLLGGLVTEAEPVQGPTGFDAALGVDLSGAVLDARSLSGRIDFGARELSMPGWDLDSAIRGKLEEKASSGAAGLLKGLLDKDDGKTEVAAEEVLDVVERLIDSLEGTLDMDRWPWGLDNIRLGVGDVDADGTGWFNPEDGSIDFTLTSRLSAAESSELLAKHSVLKMLVDGSGRVTLPVTVQGSLLAPSIKVEVSQALGNSFAGDEGDGERKEDEVKSLLKGLLERKLKKD
jgi:hypothetical protein